MAWINNFERRKAKLEKEGKLYKNMYIPKPRKVFHCEICGEVVRAKTYWWSKHPLCSYKCNKVFTDKYVDFSKGTPHYIGKQEENWYEWWKDKRSQSIGTANN